MGVADYKEPLTHSYLDVASKEYDKITSDEVWKLRSKHGAEADAQGLKGKSRGDHIRSFVGKYTDERTE